jgi:hypothetical protein
MKNCAMIYNVVVVLADGKYEEEKFEVRIIFIIPRCGFVASW